MKPRISVITLGVNNLERSVAFYRDGLGLRTDGIVGEEFDNGAVAFFDLQPGVRLALWPRQSIAYDAGVDEGKPSATELTLGHNVNSPEEVDEVVSRAREAGAVVVKEPATTFWGGYAGYFQDIDGHLWEAVYNPDVVIED